MVLGGLEEMGSMRLGGPVSYPWSSFGIGLSGWVTSPLTQNSCTLLGAEANYTSYLTGNFQTEAKSR